MCLVLYLASLLRLLTCYCNATQAVVDNGVRLDCCDPIAYLVAISIKDLLRNQQYLVLPDVAYYQCRDLVAVEGNASE